MRALVDGMKEAASNWAFGCIANTCGMIVEWGGDPGIAIEPILDRITGTLERVPDFVEVMQTHLGVEHPIGSRRMIGPRSAPPIQTMPGSSANGMPCVSPAVPRWQCCAETLNHASGPAGIELVQRAEAARSDNPYAYYLAETLALVDDERLLILDATRNLGVRVHLTAIRNDFHLFTLLQDALGAYPRPMVVSVAKSERMLSDISPNEWGPEGEGDSAIWTYYTWHALKPDGSLGTLKEKAAGQLPAWIWGEGKPTDIPLFEEERVVCWARWRCRARGARLFCRCTRLCARSWWSKR